MVFDKTNLSAQEMFNGEGFTPEWLLDKAQNELETTMKSGIRFPENVANFSVTMASMSDWAFHFQLKPFDQCSKDKEAVEKVASLCSEASLFFDISNTYKHCQREFGNKKVSKIMQYFEIVSVDKIDYLTKCAKDKNLIVNITANPKMKAIFHPVIETKDGDIKYFYDVAFNAILWWKSILENQ